MPTSYHNSSISSQKLAGTDELSMYRDLVTADRDVIRVRGRQKVVTVQFQLATGSTLQCGARDMVLAAACSLNDPRPVYRAAGANREAMDLCAQISAWGRSEQGMLCY